MPGHKDKRLPADLAVQAAVAIVHACPAMFCGAVERRMAAKSEEWQASASAEFMALLRLLKSERDFPSPTESLYDTGTK